MKVFFIGLIAFGTMCLWQWQRTLPVVHWSHTKDRPVKCMVAGKAVPCSDVNFNGIYEKVWVR